MKVDACQEFWSYGGLGDNKTRVDYLEETILRLKENMALVEIYMKEPYCEEILQEINLTK